MCKEKEKKERTKEEEGMGDGIHAATHMELIRDLAGAQAAARGAED